jgi:hypothetical protein
MENRVANQVLDDPTYIKPLGGLFIAFKMRDGKELEVTRNFHLGKLRAYLEKQGHKHIISLMKRRT